MQVLDLNLDHWEMLKSIPEQSELDFVAHDLSSICDYISNPIIDDGVPWNYDASSALTQPGRRRRI